MQYPFMVFPSHLHPTPAQVVKVWSSRNLFPSAVDQNAAPRDVIKDEDDDSYNDNEED